MDKVLGMLGLARKAGALIVGTNSVLEGVRRGTAKLVIISTDVSDGTKKRILDKCSYYNVKYEILSITRSELGVALGKGEIATVALTDVNFVAGYKKARGENNI